MAKEIFIQKGIKAGKKTISQVVYAALDMPLSQITSLINQLCVIEQQKIKEKKLKTKRR